jgi:hypothetical protein
MMSESASEDRGACYTEGFSCYFSRLLYPGKNGRLGDFLGDPGNPLSDCNPSGSKDGKYELLTAANEVIAEEIKDLMTKCNSFYYYCCCCYFTNGLDLGSY